MLNHWEQDEILEKSKLRKIVLILSYGEGCSFRLKTEHDTRAASRPKSCASKRRFRKHRPQSVEIVLGSCPGKGGSCGSETKQDRRRYNGSMESRGKNRQRGSANRPGTIIKVKTESFY
jgi:hypothetical protein